MKKELSKHPIKMGEESLGNSIMEKQAGAELGQAQVRFVSLAYSSCITVKKLCGLNSLNQINFELS